MTRTAEQIRQEMVTRIEREGGLWIEAEEMPVDSLPKPFETYAGRLARCWREAMAELDEIDNRNGVTA